MGLRFGTPEWAHGLEDAVNASSEYRNAAAAWGAGFNGNLLFAFEPDTASAPARYLLLRLGSGRCGGAEFVEQPSHPDAAFALRAPLAVWRDVLEGRTLAATAILTGRMRVEGDRVTLLKHVSAHRALVHCAASLDTDF